MFCPNCGQERSTEATRFCSRCGFLLTGAAELLQMGGIFPVSQAFGSRSGRSPRKRGLLQGLFIFLLTFLIVPIVGMISIALDIQPWAVGIAAVSLFVGGLLRMLYALMFESNDVAAQPDTVGLHDAVGSAIVDRMQHAAQLPPQRTYPVDAFSPPAVGKWRDTSDLEPTSVTESTTRLLADDLTDQ